MPEIDISAETLAVIKAAKQSREDARMARENRKVQQAEAVTADAEAMQKTTASEELAHKALAALEAELAPEPDNPPSPTPPPPAPTPEPTPLRRKTFPPKARAAKVVPSAANPTPTPGGRVSVPTLLARVPRVFSLSIAEGLAQAPQGLSRPASEAA
jgi:hypothetical protein